MGCACTCTSPSYQGDAHVHVHQVDYQGIWVQVPVSAQTFPAQLKNCSRENNIIIYELSNLRNILGRLSLLSVDVLRDKYCLSEQRQVNLRMSKRSVGYM